MNEQKTVVSGQQIGLLGGPLYTTYKVLGAHYHARQINGRAVYWLETNDADFNEINHIDYLDANNQLQTLTWEIDTNGYSCGYIEVDSTLIQLLEQFFSSLRQTDFTPELKDMVLSCYTPGRTLAEASTSLAAELFTGFDLRLFTPFETEFQTVSQHILRQEAERTPEGEQCNCFAMVGKQRKALFKKDGYFCLRDETPINPDDHILVPNVKTRSVCQDAYFHTHSYVAGPGEVKYLTQLGPVYQYHQVKQAAIQPRMSILLIEPKVQRLLKRTGLTIQQVTGTNREDLIKLVLKNETDFDMNQSLQQGNQYTETYLSQLEALGIEPSDVKSIRKLLQQEVKKVLGKIRALEKEKHQTLLQDTQYLSDNLLPYGKKQDRVFNIFYYMNLFGGKTFLKKIYENYDPARDILEI